MPSLFDLTDDESEVSLVTVTDSDGVTGEYEFLDIVRYNGGSFAVLAEPDSGDVEIFRIETDGEKEVYIRQKDEEILYKVFDIFKLKNEDEFDFD